MLMTPIHFVFIIPSHNNADWYQYNIESIAKQKCNNWRAIYVDDASTDNTLNLVRKYVSELGLTKKFTYIQNPKKLGPAGSRYQAYTQTKDNEICCMLDGDDWLYGDSVLNILNEQYCAGYNCTYGCYLTVNAKCAAVKLREINPGGRAWPPNDYPDKVHQRRYYRNIANERFFASHMRTMQSKLIKDINVDKYLKLDNKWIQVSTDMAEMFYVLEKKETKHKFINRPIYVYNAYNSKRYITSWYRRNETPETKEYREKIMNFIKNV